jgi:hypothetical protein
MLVSTNWPTYWLLFCYSSFSAKSRLVKMLNRRRGKKEDGYSRWLHHERILNFKYYWAYEAGHINDMFSSTHVKKKRTIYRSEIKPKTDLTSGLSPVSYPPPPPQPKYRRRFRYQGYVSDHISPNYICSNLAPYYPWKSVNIIFETLCT